MKKIESISIFILSAALGLWFAATIAHAIEPPADLEEMPLLVNDEECWLILDEPIEYLIDGEFDPMDEEGFIYCSCSGIPASDPQGGLPKTGDRSAGIALAMVLLFGAGVCAVGLNAK